jgi:hypothetical protein
MFSLYRGSFFPKFIDTAQATDELPEYDDFEPAPDDF